MGMTFGGVQIFADDADARTREKMTGKGVLCTFRSFVVIDDFHVDEELDAFLGVTKRVGQIEFVVPIGSNSVFEMVRGAETVKSGG